ncbi:MAG: uracil-DNA glycosylase, partial [Proteobacteria bacterium]|nr:uracil-DNA glycosylase [Pseudomonadota bacterium]
LIGEAPGADEDAQGEPFVGRAGQLLTKILEAIGFRREEVYICNILKCRPPGNREPASEEVTLCEPYLWKQLDLIKPKVILCLGRVAAQALFKTTDSLGAMRERLYDYRGAKVVVTYHPAALLRNPNWKRPAWEDVKKARALHDELVSGPVRAETPDQAQRI